MDTVQYQGRRDVPRLPTPHSPQRGQGYNYMQGIRMYLCRTAVFSFAVRSAMQVKGLSRVRKGLGPCLPMLNGTCRARETDEHGGEAKHMMIRRCRANEPILETAPVFSKLAHP